MADDFSRSMRRRESWSNAEDPTADRMGAYPDAGELGSPQDGTERVGQDAGGETVPGGPDMRGKDAEILQRGGSGDRIAGPFATSEADPGLPGHDQPAEGGREQAEDGSGDEGSLVDRMDR